MDKKLIDEINMLAKKQREEGLDDNEKERQRVLRQMYIDAVKRNFRSQLENIKIVKGDDKNVH